MRLDIALVQNKLIDTRTKAKAAIQQGLVFYKGQPVTKPSLDIQDISAITIQGQIMPYVSRGGLKLEKALQVFQINLKNQIVLDIGSSTGGFTDCALQHGAKRVIAVDVGKEQMVESLRLNPAITLYEQTDFRTIEADKISSCTVAVSDVSFISITKMIPKLKEMPNLTDLICLIKPQFECGKEMADKYHGVIKNKKIHESILNQIVKTFQENNFYLQNLTFSPIHGGSGNIEYLAHFTKNPTNFIPNFSQIITEAFRSAL